MNPARESILIRVRAGLRAAAPRPPTPSDSPLWPPIGDMETRFRDEFTELRGEFLSGTPALRDFLGPFQSVATDGSELVRAILGDGTAAARVADLGVTSCDCLVAQTGSIFLTTRSAGGRSLSILPPAHLVVARRDQIVPDLATAFALMRNRYDRHWPSLLCLISGPSRTGDIEKILVMGAHGPKRLAVYFAG